MPVSKPDVSNTVAHAKISHATNLMINYNSNRAESQE